MSSPLDGRIRHIAREVLAEAGTPTAEGLASGAPAEDDGRLARLEKQIADLTSRLEKLETAPQRARTARKATGE
jgi:hypothetical protein